MPETTVTIYLKFDGTGHDDNTLKESLYQYLTDLIDDDSLVYYIKEEE
jgi:hypothetical protein